MSENPVLGLLKFHCTYL